MRSKSSYESLKALSKEGALLTSISRLLGWDLETMMPKEGIKIRAEALSLMARLFHEVKAGKKFRAHLFSLIDLKSGKIKKSGLTAIQRANVREWRRDFNKEAALPPSFVSDFADLTAKAAAVWSRAKKEDDFSLFAPTLEKIVTQVRKKADFLGYEKHPYDALLDCYEPETSIELIDPLFGPLERHLKGLVSKIVSVKEIDDFFLRRPLSEKKQLKVGRDLLEKIGFDFSKGRFDLSAHPFSTAIAPNDLRITTRIEKRAPTQSLFALLHEAGHSFYEGGLDENEVGTPVGEPLSYALHESQSRFWETRIGQSKAFWRFFLPTLKKEYSAIQGHSLDSFYRAINKVKPSFIRVDADEVSYSLHIILRYELEKELISGKMKVKEIPEAWNEKMRELLGIIPTTYPQGCLQDIHWSMGAFGYFPSYTLGNLYAAHFFNAFEKAFPDWEKRIERGEFQFVLMWLHEKIHRFGRLYTSKELLKKVSHESLSVEPYLNYLNKKYSALYHF